MDSSIYYAEVSGWLVGAGEPPKSVAVTADGVRLLEECGSIKPSASLPEPLRKALKQLFCMC